MGPDHIISTKQAINSYQKVIHRVLCCKRTAILNMTGSWLFRALVKFLRPQSTPFSASHPTSIYGKLLVVEGGTLERLHQSSLFCVHCFLAEFILKLCFDPKTSIYAQTSCSHVRSETGNDSIPCVRQDFYFSKIDVCMYVSYE